MKAELRDWRRWAWIAIAVVAAFIIGFAWQGIRAARLDNRLEQTSQALTLHRLEAALAVAVFEAQRGSYEMSRLHASDFFSGVQSVAPNVPSAVRQDLMSILGERDQTITLLSRGDPEAADQLAGIYVRYRDARGRAEQALPRVR